MQFIDLEKEISVIFKHLCGENKDSFIYKLYNYLIFSMEDYNELMRAVRRIKEMEGISCKFFMKRNSRGENLFYCITNSLIIMTAIGYEIEFYNNREVVKESGEEMDVEEYERLTDELRGDVVIHILNKIDKC